MINFCNQVPSIYPSASRDFQYMSWLVNIVLNSVKHNVDDMYNLPDIGGDPKLTELLALTLGFKVKRNYDKKQLMALVSVLPHILKYKGTEKAIMTAANALIMASGSLGEPDVEIIGTEVVVTLPNDLIDITLFLDLLDYILPAGMTCHIQRKNEKHRAIDNIQLRHKDVLRLLLADDLAWKNNNTKNIGLSGLYELENTAIVLGKAATNTIAAGGLTSVNVIANVSKITMENPSTWSFIKQGNGVKIMSATGKYLAHRAKFDDDSQPVPYVELVSELNDATEWHVEANGSSFKISTVDNDTTYLLAYNSRQQFCTYNPAKKHAGSNVSDLNLYRKIDESKDLIPICTFEAITGDFTDTDDDKLLIVAQGTPEFTANIKRFGDNFVLNTGLLNITVIPTLHDGLLVTPEDTVALYTLEVDQEGKKYILPLLADGSIQLRAKKVKIQEY